MSDWPAPHCPLSRPPSRYPRAFFTALRCAALLALFASFAAGCSPMHMASREESDAARSMPVPKGKALVYIFRSENSGAVPWIDVSINGEYIGQTVARGFLVVEVEPGPVSVVSEWSFGLDPQSVTVNLTAESGQRYFVLQEPRFGMGLPRVAMTRVHEARASRTLSQGRLIAHVRGFQSGGETSPAALPVADVRPLVAQPPPPEEREHVAILAFQASGVTAQEANIVTDRFGEELLKTRWFTLVDRSQMDALLEEQAFQQSACSATECAVEAGRILGVRRIIAGKLTHARGDLWVVSAIMVDVETGELLQADSVRYEGRFLKLIDDEITGLAVKMTGRRVGG